MPWYWAPKEIACYNKIPGTEWTITHDSLLFKALNAYNINQ
jgi:hypothetical protein